MGRRRVCFFGGFVRSHKIDEICELREKESGKLTYRPPVANRPADHTPRVASGSDFQGEDLGRVQPRDGQPRRSENGGEEEDKENGTSSHAGSALASMLGVDRGASEAPGAEHTDTLTD